MNGKGQHLGVQQILVLFMVGTEPGISRKRVRDRFQHNKLPFDGTDRRLRELDEKGLLLRAKTGEGTTLRLSKVGKEEFDRLAPAFRDSLLISEKQPKKSTT